MHTLHLVDGYEWDPAKAAANLAKHKAHFADAALSLEGPRALTMADPDAGGAERFLALAGRSQRASLGNCFRPRRAEHSHHLRSPG